MDAAPIFLLGAPRSGTTLFSLMLDGHSRIAIPYESHFIPDFFQRQSQLGDFADRRQREQIVASILNQRYVREWDRRLTLSDIDLNRCNDLASAIDQVFGAYARRRGKPQWGDKTPGYTNQAHILNSLFPRCKFIHLIRDGRDVAVSHAQQTWGPADWPTALARWASTVDCARRMLRMLPADRQVELRFEDLLEAPEQQLRNICDFLGLSFEPAMLQDYQQRAISKVGERIQNQHRNLTQQPNLLEVAKWKRRMGGADQAIAHEIAGPLLQELGYPSGATSHSLRLWRKFSYGLRRVVTRRLNRLHPRNFRTRST